MSPEFDFEQFCFTGMYFEMSTQNRFRGPGLESGPAGLVSLGEVGECCPVPSFVVAHSGFKETRSTGCTYFALGIDSIGNTI